MDELSQIRQKIDIISFISEYLPLKKAGRNFKVCCPFHNEKTPSFVVSPERQIFHCFGCNVGGDIFTFLMKYENLEFPEALRTLAQRAGVELKRGAYDSQASKVRARLYEINHLASEFYHYLLTAHPSGKKALEYLKKRGVNEGSIKTWKIGFGPNLWDALIRFLVKKKRYSLSDLTDAGLVVGGKDRFRNRIIFPLSDHRGNIVGFSGRVLSDVDGAKYINTPETLIYHKGNLFYGLDRAREEIKKENAAIIVEGEFDVIQSFQNGIKNVVAIKGTALTQNQASLIRRFTENISLCLDKDSAGELASKRGIEILEEANLQVSVIKLDFAKDPDEALRKNRVAFKKAIKTTVPVYDFLIGGALAKFNPQTASGKKKISDEIIPFLVKITNEIVKNHYIKKLAQELEVSEGAVIAEIEKIEKKTSQPGGLAAGIKQGKKDREEILAEYLLALLIQSHNPKIFLSQLDNILKELFLRTSLYRKIFQNLRDFLTKTKFSIKKFVEFVPPEITPAIDRSFLLTLPVDLSEEKYLLEVEKTIRELKTLSLRKNMQEIAQKIKLAESQKNEKELTILKNSFKKMTTELSAFTTIPTLNRIP